MADEPSPRENPEVDAATAKDDGRRHISIVTQYAKDLSFENPRAPASVLDQGAEPHGDISVQVKSRKLGGDEYEVVLEFQIEAKREGEVAFLIELQYAGVFRLAGFSDKELGAVQMIECPRLIYPFARRIIADTVRDGGFPQMMLPPMDFVALFRMHEKKRNAEPEAGETGPDEPEAAKAGPDEPEAAEA
ncbi:MAG: protein-export chaperone SecB [Proteobacteria bacterium]|nr:protein-export chaperone SecB [Pseudomonadota bacterium]